MIDIVFYHPEQEIVSAEGQHFEVYIPFIWHEGELKYLCDPIDFSKINGLRLWLRHKSFPRLRLPLFTTVGLEKSILEFLRLYRNKVNYAFDCYSFVCLVNNLYSLHNKLTMGELWSTKKRRRLAHTGDVIFLTKNDGYFLHAAIYVGLGHYVSVSASGGYIALATLKNMLRDYRADKAVLATPRLRK